MMIINLSQSKQYFKGRRWRFWICAFLLPCISLYKTMGKRMLKRCIKRFLMAFSIVRLKTRKWERYIQARGVFPTRGWGQCWANMSMDLNPLKANTPSLQLAPVITMSESQIPPHQGWYNLIFDELYQYDNDLARIQGSWSTSQGHVQCEWMLQFESLIKRQKEEKIYWAIKNRFTCCIIVTRKSSKIGSSWHVQAFDIA